MDYAKRLEEILNKKCSRGRLWKLTETFERFFNFKKLLICEYGKIPWGEIEKDFFFIKNQKNLLKISKKVSLKNL